MQCQAPPSHHAAGPLEARVVLRTRRFEPARGSGPLPPYGPARYRSSMAKGYLDIEDDIAALATPPGTGALAVVRVAGPGSVDRLARVFSRPDVLRGTAGYSAAYGRISGGDGVTVDEVVALAFRAPASYTGQDGADIMCHGGQATVDGVLAALDSAGFRRALPGEFTLRAFRSVERR